MSIPESGRQPILSIHDVAPETLPQVENLIGLLDGHDAGPAMLLVIPGRPWKEAQIAMLRTWQEAGHVLAGHGWHHRANRIRGWRHRLHSLLLSRDVAEHLALDVADIETLIRRCHAWFTGNGLPAPDLYVPPAWAMGALPRARLAGLPFARYEVLSGIIDGASGRLQRLPLVGFEADRTWRALPLRLWNSTNRIGARHSGLPLRIAIHPHDLSLRLSGDLMRLIASVGRNRSEAGA